MIRSGYAEGAETYRKMIRLALDRSATDAERFTVWNQILRRAFGEGLTGHQFLDLLGLNPNLEFLQKDVPPEECVHGLRVPWGRYVGETYESIAKKDATYLRWLLTKLPDVHREAAEAALL